MTREDALALLRCFVRERQTTPPALDEKTIRKAFERLFAAYPSFRAVP